MRIAIVGGGPAGLYFAILAKRLDPSHEVVVHERNAADDTFGFGVVFSDETLEGIEAADPETFATLAPQFARWAEIDIHYKGEVVTSGGHGFSALSRRELLDSLQRTNCRVIASKDSGSAASNAASVSSENTTPKPNVSSGALRSWTTTS